MNPSVGEEMALAEALQKARKASGLTQQDLCHKAGISYSTLAKIERGAIQAPSIFTIHSIAQVLGITLNDLVGSAMPAPPYSTKKTSISGVKFVFFDVNGCLVRFYHRAFTQIAVDSGKPADVVEMAFWTHNDAVCRGELPVEEFNHVLGSKFGLPEFDWRAYYLHAVEPIAEMHSLLSWVSENYGVGLLTNIMPGQIQTMIDQKLIPDIPYTAVIDSSEAHAIKPEPEIYDLAAAKAGCEPSEIMLVDDTRANIVAASRAGWHVLWFDDFHPEESAKRIRATLEPTS